MVTDSIADYLTRIRNAVMAKHKVVEIPASNLKKEITKIEKTIARTQKIIKATTDFTDNTDKKQ